MNITLAILTNYSGGDIKKTIASAQFCDDILVFEDGDIKKLRPSNLPENTRFYSRLVNGDFASQRNFAISKAQTDWILFLDDDEKLTSELAVEIQKVIKSDGPTVYRLRRRDFFWKTELKHGETALARSHGYIRLMKKGSSLWKGRVHETYITEKKVGQLMGFINHYPHPTVTSFINSVNIYSTLRAEELWRQGKKSSTIDLLFLPAGKFIYTYFFKFGFLDGPAGFMYSFMMSFHSFLVRAKLLQYEEIT